MVSPNTGTTIEDESIFDQLDAYTAYCTPNFLKSSDTRLCDYTQNWFDNIPTKSTVLTLGSDKSRDGFFHEIGQKVAPKKQRIQLHLEDTFE